MRILRMKIVGRAAASSAFHQFEDRKSKFEDRGMILSPAGGLFEATGRSILEPSGNASHRPEELSRNSRSVLLSPQLRESDRSVRISRLLENF